MPETRYNIVTFKPDREDGQRVPVALEGRFRFRIGVRPDFNFIRVGADSFAALADDLERGGTLELWFTSNPFAESAGAVLKPDVAIESLRIVGVEAAEQGSLDDPPESAGATGITEYRLRLADFRQALIAPRGGRLTSGLVNPTPAEPSSPAIDFDVQAPEHALAELIQQCLDAMDLSDVALPNGLEDLDAPRDLRWFGSHAPSELMKLLERGGCIFVPHFDGTASVERLGAAPAPEIAPDQVLPEQTLPPADRRGSAVVFASYPNRNLVSRVIDGPSSSGWFFVAQDSDGTWKAIDSCSIFSGGAASHVRDHFARVPLAFRERARSQAFRFIKLSDSVVPPGVAPVLARDVAANGAAREIMVRARIATQDPLSGRWTNSGEFISIPVRFKSAGNVLHLGEMLGRVTNSTDDREADFAEVAAGDFNVRFTTEDAKETDGQWSPAYFHAGFRRQAGQIAALNDQEIVDALEGRMPDALVISRPELRLIIVDGVDQNREALESAARAQAEQHLRDADKSLRIITARGFVPIALSGSVHEVQYDQRAVKTTARLNDAFGDLDPPDESGCTACDRNAAGTSASALALGASGSTLPVEAVSPLQSIPRPARSMFLVALAHAGGADGTNTSPASWTYDVFGLDGGEALASGAAVAKDRALNCSMSKATRGLAYRDSSGMLHLWDTNERMNQNNCT